MFVPFPCYPFLYYLLLCICTIYLLPFIFAISPFYPYPQLCRLRLRLPFCLPPFTIVCMCFFYFYVNRLSSTFIYIFCPFAFCNLYLSDCTTRTTTICWTVWRSCTPSDTAYRTRYWRTCLTYVIRSTKATGGATRRRCTGSIS